MPFRVVVAVSALLVVVSSACSYTLRELDAELPANAQSSVVLAADGTLITRLHAEEDRTEIPLELIPRHLQSAVIAVEDERFWQHHGVDLRAVLRALRENTEAGGVTQGGSTITQQLVKNLLLDDERSLDRKVQEAVLAWQFEDRYSKARILELYLNTIYFGGGAYGVLAAAREYFGVTVDQLTLPQSALLAGLIQAPSTTDPYDAPDAAVARRNLVLGRMLEQHLIDQAAHDAAVATPLVLTPYVPVTEQRYPAAHFVEEVKRLILDDEAFGATAQERRRLLFTGGLTIETTIDLRLQQMAEEAVAAELPDPETDPEAALVAVEPDTGFVRAMVGGRDFFGATAQAKYNLATGKGRPTGSSFKPLVLAAALQLGIPMSQRFNAPGSMTLTYDDPPRRWNVDNYGEGGPGVPVDLVEATVRSYNTVYAQLILEVGAERAVELASELGITTPLDAAPAAVLGANDVQPLEMAAAFGTLANRGVRVPPVIVTRVEAPDGTVLYEHEASEERVIDEAVADQVTDVLTQVIDRGTGTSARLPRPAAGKTGTGQNWYDAWFCGYVPQLATAVWVGFPGEQISMTPPRTPLRVTGGSYPARIWQRFMSVAVADLPVEGFIAPTRTTAVPQSTEPGEMTTLPGQAIVPAVVGLHASQARAALQGLGFAVSEVSTNSGGAAGIVVGQSPSGGSAVQRGTTVTITVTTGSGGGGPGGPGAPGGPGTQPAAPPTEGTVVVPSVVGLSEGAAGARITDAGLRPQPEDRADPSGDARRGYVWSQSPGPGSRVPRGSAVVVYVAT